MSEKKKVDWMDVRNAIVVLLDADALSSEAALSAAYHAGFENGIAAEKREALKRVSAGQMQQILGAHGGGPRV
jgi:hypothetical protein